MQQATEKQPVGRRPSSTLITAGYELLGTSRGKSKGHKG